MTRQPQGGVDFVSAEVQLQRCGIRRRRVCAVIAITIVSGEGVMFMITTIMITITT